MVYFGKMRDGDPRHRIAHVDGLRAIAVLSVVAFHTAKYSGMSATAPFAWFFRSGSHGVDLFFVLSGFCLSYPTLARLNWSDAAIFDVAGFASRRLVRIIPPYLIAISAFIIFAAVLGGLGLQLPKAMPQNGFSVIDVAEQALFLDSTAKFLSGSFWTLPIEFRWYFVFPLFLWLWTKSPKAFVLVGLASLGLIATRAGSVDLFVLPAFLLGIVAAALAITKVRLGYWPTIAFLVTLAAAYATMGNSGWEYTYNALWYLSAFAFVVLVSDNGAVARLLSVRALAAVGLASYSIYLVHEPVIAFLEEHAVQPYVAAVVAVVLGFLFWMVAERPFVETPVRERLLREFDPVFKRWFPRIGLPIAVKLTKPAGSSAPESASHKDQSFGDSSSRPVHPVETAR
jgi:peptidoglycan/LPS O-acetylase OafA/YrhL